RDPSHDPAQLSEVKQHDEGGEQEPVDTHGSAARMLPGCGEGVQRARSTVHQKHGSDVSV
ncbi:MAG TPA: hypothetical protein VFS23_42435, partial [Vicinamibacterales bacterium]|nr:hypothetical protein [Vicinamibacterales bacterium]